MKNRKPHLALIRASILFVSPEPVKAGPDGPPLTRLKVLTGSALTKKPPSSDDGTSRAIAFR
jgi:hypothetical protein